jgi:hypothetical protein
MGPHSFNFGCSNGKIVRIDGEVSLTETMTPLCALGKVVLVWCSEVDTVNSDLELRPGVAYYLTLSTLTGLRHASYIVEENTINSENAFNSNVTDR